MNKENYSYMKFRSDDKFKEIIDNNLKLLSRINEKGMFSYLLNGEWIASCFLGRKLEKLGMTIQDWYDKYILEINNSDDRPKCIADGCNKTAKFSGIRGGYRTTCGSHECLMKVRSESAKIQMNSMTSEEKSRRLEKWKSKMPNERMSKLQCEVRDRDPERYSRIRSENGKNKSQSVRDSISEKKKNWWSNEDNHRNMVQKLSDNYKINPEISRKKSNSLKETFSRPERKKNLIESQKKKWENPTERMINPKYKYGRIKGTRYSGVKSRIYSRYEDKFISFDSNWEKFWFINESNNPDIVSIRRCNISIPYTNQYGETHRYIPDFIVEYYSGNRELVEIKPSSRLNEIDTILKIKSGISYAFLHNLNYKILTEITYKFLSEED